MSLRWCWGTCWRWFLGGCLGQGLGLPCIGSLPSLSGPALPPMFCRGCTGFVLPARPCISLSGLWRGPFSTGLGPLLLPHFGSALAILAFQLALLWATLCPVRVLLPWSYCQRFPVGPPVGHAAVCAIRAGPGSSCSGSLRGTSVAQGSPPASYMFRDQVFLAWCGTCRLGCGSPPFSSLFGRGLRRISVALGSSPAFFRRGSVSSEAPPFALRVLLHVASFVVPLARATLGILFLCLCRLLCSALPGRASPLGRLLSRCTCSGHHWPRLLCLPTLAYLDLDAACSHSCSWCLPSRFWRC